MSRYLGTKNVDCGGCTNAMRRGYVHIMAYSPWGHKYLYRMVQNWRDTRLTWSTMHGFSRASSLRLALVCFAKQAFDRSARIRQSSRAAMRFRYMSEASAKQSALLEAVKYMECNFTAVSFKSSVSVSTYRSVEDSWQPSTSSIRPGFGPIRRSGDQVDAEVLMSI